MLTDREAVFVREQRVGHLATADEHARPQVVPICYAFDGAQLYVAIDEKPKRVGPTELRRVRNILANPQVAVVVDRYRDDWSQLAWVQFAGRAELVDDAAERERAIDLLRAKYPPYRMMDLEARPLIRITPERVSSWGAV